MVPSVVRSFKHNHFIPPGSFHGLLQLGSFIVRLIRLLVFLKLTAQMQRMLFTKQRSSREISYWITSRSFLVWLIYEIGWGISLILKWCWNVWFTQKKRVGTHSCWIIMILAKMSSFCFENLLRNTAD